MTTFVSSAGVTVSKLLENGKLWVAEQLPPDGDPRLTRVRAVAEESDDLSRLTTKWLQKMGLDVPRERELRARALLGGLREREPIVLVIENAHVLRTRTLIGCRPLMEQFAPVLLVGDVLAIGARVRTNQSFMLRAGFCVNALQLWEVPPLKNPI